MKNVHSLSYYQKLTNTQKGLRLIKKVANPKTGGEDRTRTCKPVKAVVFKTTALPIMLLLRNWQFENIP